MEQKTLVVGLGNPILGDDGVGWAIVEAVAQRLAEEPHLHPNIYTVCLGLGGLSLMEQLIGYERVILVDAINLGQATPGTISCFPLDELPQHAPGHTSSSHDTSLQHALEVGHQMGAALPESITIVGIETPHVYEFSEKLSPLVEAAVPKGAQMVWELLTKSDRN